MVGDANAALGTNAGTDVTGDSNIAVGAGAGSPGAAGVPAGPTTLPAVIDAISNTRSIESSRLHETSTAGLTGSDNIAIGRMAGLGNGAPFSASIALGAAAQAPANGSIAIGQGATSTAPGSVAIGAGSIASDPNTVSIGSASAQRRIVNVAPGLASSDGATVGQIRALAKAFGGSIKALGELVEANNDSAHKGIALSMAQSGATPAPAPSGRTAISLGVGTYGSQTALGLGVSSQSTNGKRGFSFAASMSPGSGDVGAQAGMRRLLGRSTQVAQHESAAPAPKTDTGIPIAQWRALGYSRVRVLLPERQILANRGATTYRFTASEDYADSGSLISWSCVVDRLREQRGAAALTLIWETVSIAAAGPSFTTPTGAFEKAVRMLAR